jgi:uncharacterized membrane-anchored protein YitT (DUF2179 family)
VSALRRFISKERLLRHPIRDYFWMTVGILLTAFALDSFLIPNRLAAGGLSGLATVIHYEGLKFGLTLPVGLQMLAMNVVLLVIGLRARGWRYGAKTIYGTVALSLAIDALAPFAPHLAAHDPLLAVLYGGALIGLGLGLVFKAGGNTGGTDLIAQLLTPHISLGIGQLMVAADALVMAVAAWEFGPTLALYGFVAVFITGAVVDIVQEGVSVEKAAYIITEKSEEVAALILNELGRGATGLMGRGLYTDTPREVILTVVSRREIDKLKDLVQSVDPTAFLIISDVHEVMGEGFKRMHGV